MANRMTQMDGEVPRSFPVNAAREQGTRFPIKIPTQASPKQNEDLDPKRSASGSKSVSPSESKPYVVSAENHNFTKIVRTKSRTSYHTFMPLDQAGPAVIARENMGNRDFVAIKRVKRDDRGPVYRVEDFTSEHLVNIRDMFLDGDDIVIVYEQMDVSLKHIMAVTGGPLQAFEIAAICRELTDGLSYIHAQLSLYHGALICSNILLHQNGKIKIANIAESILERKVFSVERGLADIKSMGPIMIELMEPATSILDPTSAVLKQPEKWRNESGIKDFLAATQNQPLTQLMTYPFLPPKPQGSCLRPHIFAAVRAANVSWDKPSLT